MTDLPLHVIEVQARDIDARAARAAQAAAGEQPRAARPAPACAASIATCRMPPAACASALRAAGIEAQVEATRANLEDVFVAATLPRQERASTRCRMNASRDSLTRIRAVAGKEIRQLRRDRLTGGMIVGIPLIQILIFGYGINFDVRHISRRRRRTTRTPPHRALLVGQLEATQVVRLHGACAATCRRAAAAAARPARSPRASTSRRTSSAAASSATGRWRSCSSMAASPESKARCAALATMPLRAARRRMPLSRSAPLEVLTEYNPERRTAVQIVPALIGVILTMTMVIFTAIALVRERERGNLELLITTPVRSVELMIGKLAPYVVVGLIQTTLILSTGVLLFDVPINGQHVAALCRREPVHRRDPGPGARDLDRRPDPVPGHAARLLHHAALDSALRLPVSLRRHAAGRRNGSRRCCRSRISIRSCAASSCAAPTSATWAAAAQADGLPGGRPSQSRH